VHLVDQAGIQDFYAKLVVVKVEVAAAEECACSPAKKELCFEFGVYRDSASSVGRHMVRGYFREFDCSTLSQRTSSDRVWP
jgi:hypothetical protein